MRTMFLFLFLFNACLAQTIVTDIEDPFIEVAGSAEMEIVPDEVYISVSLRERFENKAKISIEEQETRIKGKIKSFGILPEALTVIASKTEQVKTGKKNTALIRQNDYLIKLSEPDAVSKLIGIIQSENVHNIYIAKLNHSKIEEYKNEVKLKAVKAAKIKAENLLSAIGEVLGKVIFIIEKDDKENPVHREIKELEFIKIILHYKVTGRFEIE